ncbi:hypothetical protein EG68_07020 [Paragonimus skrjabini miyazakii]|uniref:Cystatin domain-containing protein n=1 Tax=Paragonimus skrjabini miyazakii TaxID=59628 RepID=A0A8S9YZ64_9TREM|nr:hypothetical protein EG68_07020 [Paragonimus skrjabini miyazakii]
MIYRLLIVTIMCCFCSAFKVELLDEPCVQNEEDKRKIHSLIDALFKLNQPDFTFHIGWINTDILDDDTNRYVFHILLPSGTCENVHYDFPPNANTLSVKRIEVPCSTVPALCDKSYVK